MIQPEAFHHLVEDIRNCSKCQFIEFSGSPVPPEGDLSSKILIVGRNPGYQEYLQGRPFVGPGGQCLNRWLGKISLDRETIMIANMVCCYTANDRPPDDSEITLCLPFLKRLIGLQKPRWIVALGKQALHALVNTLDSPVYAHGQTYDVLYKTPEGLVESQVFCSWHPGSCLRKPEAMSEFMEDADKFCRIVGGSS
jgi:DNA polymerase